MAGGSQPRKFTDKELAAALRKNGGIQARAAKDLGVSRAAVFLRVNRANRRGEKLRAVLAEMDAENLDVAQGTVMDGLATDLPTARWFLERRGKHLGFGNSTAIRLSDADLEALVDTLAGNPDALRKLAAGG